MRRAERTAPSELHPNLIAAEAGSPSILEPQGRDAYYAEGAATLGDRLAAARANAGLTQAGLAQRLGVGAKVVSGWENDRSEPRANRVSMLCGLLGVSVSWLLTGAGQGVPPPGEAEPDASADRPRAGAPEISLVVADLEAARRFYCGSLGAAPLEAAAGHRLDVELFGLRIALHCGAPAAREIPPAIAWMRDGDGAPVPSVGIHIGRSDWTAFTARLRGAGVGFLLEPAVFDIGGPSERALCAVGDPSGNVFTFRARGGAV